jgi:hypothetical protein
MLPYDELPIEQRFKDRLFQSIAKTMLSQQKRYELLKSAFGSGEG